MKKKDIEELVNPIYFKDIVGSFRYLTLLDHILFMERELSIDL